MALWAATPGRADTRVGCGRRTTGERSSRHGPGPHERATSIPAEAVDVYHPLQRQANSAAGAAHAYFRSGQSCAGCISARISRTYSGADGPESALFGRFYLWPAARRNDTKRRPSSPVQRRRGWNREILPIPDFNLLWSKIWAILCLL